MCVFLLVVKLRTDPCVGVLRGLPDLADPAGQVLQTVCCHVQGLNRVRGEVLGVDGEHEGPRVLPVFVNHWTERRRERVMGGGRTSGGETRVLCEKEAENESVDSWIDRSVVSSAFSTISELISS